MPRPPTIPLLDWKAIFEAGKDFDTWLAGAESAENRQKMDALLMDQELEPQVLGFLASLPRPVHIVAIAEDWCGDVVRYTPVLQRICQAAPSLHLRFVTRTQFPDLFVRFLTNGGEAIPKFIFLSDAFVECGNWGPMPAVQRELIARGKACGNVAAARKKVAAFYEADTNNRMVVSELLHLIDIAVSRVP
jgi:hypothetical protein